jgi:hypothetical protein
LDFFYKHGEGYPQEMMNRPQTIYGIGDSPVGLAAWLLDKLDKGGHFAAWEQPKLFSEEVRAAFKSLRYAQTQAANQEHPPARRPCEWAAGTYPKTHSRKLTIKTRRLIYEHYSISKPQRAGQQISRKFSNRSCDKSSGVGRKVRETADGA